MSKRDILILALVLALVSALLLASCSPLSGLAYEDLPTIKVSTGEYLLGVWSPKELWEANFQVAVPAKESFQVSLVDFPKGSKNYSISWGLGMPGTSVECLEGGVYQISFLPCPSWTWVATLFIEGLGSERRILFVLE